MSRGNCEDCVVSKDISPETKARIEKELGIFCTLGPCKGNNQTRRISEDAKGIAIETVTRTISCPLVTGIERHLFYAGVNHNPRLKLLDLIIGGKITDRK